VHPVRSSVLAGYSGVGSAAKVCIGRINKYQIIQSAFQALTPFFRHGDFLPQWTWRKDRFNLM
jgi:hypothetical protein